MKIDFYKQLISNLFYKYVYLLVFRKTELKKNELYIFFKDYNFLDKFFSVLKNNTLIRMRMLVDICVIDYYTVYKRFDIVYNFLSIEYNFKFFFKFRISENIFLPSVNHLYGGSNWIEREVWDLFGIYFYNNIDLRRILSDYGFVGYPLRKDFPLTGYIELRYNDTYLSLQYENVELSQDYRVFSLNSPWEVKDLVNYFV